MNLCRCELQALQMNTYGVRPPRGLEASGEVIGADELAQMGSQLIVGFVEVAFDGRVFDGAVGHLSKDASALSADDLRR